MKAIMTNLWKMKKNVGLFCFCFVFVLVCKLINAEQVDLLNGESITYDEVFSYDEYGITLKIEDGISSIPWERFSEADAMRLSEGYFKEVQAIIEQRRLESERLQMLQEQHLLEQNKPQLEQAVMKDHVLFWTRDQLLDLKEENQKLFIILMGFVGFFCLFDGFLVFRWLNRRKNRNENPFQQQEHKPQNNHDLSLDGSKKKIQPIFYYVASLGVVIGIFTYHRQFLSLEQSVGISLGVPVLSLILGKIFQKKSSN